MIRKYIFTCLIILSIASPASGGQIGDVTLPDQITVADSTLTLNGLGMRTFTFFDVYAAGLYLPTPSTDAGKILATDAPRGMTMHFLRKVEAEKIADAWLEGLAANTPAADASLQERFVALGSMMETMDKGETLSCLYNPADGTTIMVRGQLKGVIPGKDFNDALLGCWIGPKPGPGEKFKAGILGQR
ncbi:chalcone isomerase family protein [Desulfomicrobium baculatum]|uniref:Putative lipoprotein transmembrane n=1 Tax=Desulfomicrobium baculatum (strain DSM 4028 / VKM B-1378 / X) TaxID=525897 RepID=C7LNT3_DESBD|nr:chalcone isomerase family protein [Desulfomicrobium baculatum]ACU90157.1 putative lipoprotein transmembrane [Desulfomicrobium baculatum DSM 4028]